MCGACTTGVLVNPDFRREFFPSALDSDEGDAYCKYDDQLIALFTSSLYLSAAIAALVGGWLSQRFGRKASMTVAAVLFGAGTALSTGAIHISMLVIGRMVQGFGVGLAGQSVPLFLSETAPDRIRGTMNNMYAVLLLLYNKPI